MAKASAVLTLRRNGQITLPSEVRRRMRASEGDVFVAEVRTPDELVLRKKSLVDASQAYFWTDEWQRGCYANVWNQSGGAMSFAIYVIGILLLLGGLIYGATLMHLAPHWIVVGAIVIAGLAVMSGVQATRQKDAN